MRASLILTAVLLWAVPVQAETLSVATHSADIHSRPDRSSLVQLLAPRWYPLEVRDEEGDFYLVEDYRGRTGWIVKELVKPEPAVVVTGSRVNVRQGPGLDQPVVFRAFQGVTFKVLEDRGNWVRVKHESGRTGWIAKSLVWGGN